MKATDFLTSSQGLKEDLKIFLVSGLGADRRTFNFLQLDFQDSITFVDWIQPHRKESLPSYCSRLAIQYNVDERSVVIGLSFGGIVAVEISKQIKLLKTIILSSARNRNDLSVLFRISGKMGLHKLISEHQIRRSNIFMEKAFGASTKEEKQMLEDVLKNTNVEVAKWAIREMTNWKESGKNEYILRIHGDRDKIIPLKNSANYVIHDGGHMMITQRAKEISKILNEEIRTVIRDL